MDLQKAVEHWSDCNRGRDKCLGEKKCVNYILIDPRTRRNRGVGPGTTGQRTLCSLLDDLNSQVKRKTEFQSEQGYFTKL